MVGLGRLELPTSRLSGVRSNRLSYKPIKTHRQKISLPRKEVIQPHVLIRLPCYDFTPVTGFALGRLCPTSGTPGFHGVTGGVYKTRERIHRGILIRDY